MPWPTRPMASLVASIASEVALPRCSTLGCPEVGSGNDDRLAASLRACAQHAPVGSAHKFDHRPCRLCGEAESFKPLFDYCAKAGRAVEALSRTAVTTTPARNATMIATTVQSQ